MFTKGMDSVNREGNSNTLFSVTNLMYLILFFALNIAGFFCVKYFCFFGGGTLAGEWGTETFCVHESVT